jgi:hypothetical protein
VKLPRELITATLTLLLSASGLVSMAAGAPRADLIVIGAAARKATLTAVEADGTLQFRDGGGEPLAVSPDELVRWSTPVAPRATDEMLLADGSRIGIAAAWGNQLSITFDGDRGEARSTRFGRIKFNRSTTRAILWHLPLNEDRRTKLIDALAPASSSGEEADRLVLENGDVLTGTLTRIGASQAGEGDGDAQAAVATFEGNLGRTDLPLERIRAVVFSVSATSESSTLAPSQKLIVGLDDGSRISVNAVRGAGASVMLSTPLRGELRIDRVEQVASVQSVGGRAVYLSDLEPSSYREEPYLDLAWNYQRDRNVLSGPLRVGGQTFLKGLGMHSAARLTYALAGRYNRFAAHVGIDDAAEGRGSVVFRVFLKSNGSWREAHASGVVRGGKPLHEIAVELGDARELALVVDYADRGDERDYANWVDARLERIAR